MAALTLVQIVPPAPTAPASEDATQAAQQANDTPVLQGLARQVADRLADARTARQAVLPRLQAARRARDGEYSPEKLAEIRKFGGSEVFLRVIANKCMILLALLKDVYLGQTDKPWSLKPTAAPAIPATVTQDVRDQLAQEVAAVYTQTGQMPDQAAVRATQAEMQERAEMRLREAARQMVERMERKMEDQLSEGGFAEAMAGFLSDFVAYPTAIFKGPILRKRKRLVWAPGADGKVAPTVSEDIVPEFERVNPFRVYPSAGAGSPQEGSFIEHVSLTYGELHDMIGTPGVNEAAVRAALAEADDNGLTNWFGWTELTDEPDPDNVSPHLKRKTFNIDCILFYGPVKGRDLLDWGIEDPIDDPDAEYETAVWMVGKWVIKAHLNYDPLGVRPYFSASYNKIPGQFWGESIPDMLVDLAGDDGLMQVCSRALANNAAFASGPLVGLNIDRLAPGTDLSTLHPWQQFQLINAEYGNSADRPLEFFQPQMHAQELLFVLDKLYQYADSFSMIPRSAAGDSPTGGVGRTASGFAIQMDAAGKGLKAAVLNVDAVLSGLLEKLYNHNMQFDTDETLKGDAQVVARGAISLMQKESLRIRRNEALQATNNPTDLQIMGLAGRAELLRTTLDDLEVDPTRVVPTREQLAQMQAPAQPPTQPPAQPSAGPTASEEVLPSGHPTTDTFSPNAMTPARGQGFAEGGVVQSNWPGMLAAGNIDLHKRPVVHNPDGSISTVRSASFNFEGRETLLPMISPDGKNWTAKEAVDNYRRTGQHLGQFDTPEHASAYAQRLHEDQAREYLPNSGSSFAFGGLVIDDETRWQRSGGMYESPQAMLAAEFKDKADEFQHDLKWSGHSARSSNLPDWLSDEYGQSMELYNKNKSMLTSPTTPTTSTTTEESSTPLGAGLSDTDYKIQQAGKRADLENALNDLKTGKLSPEQFSKINSGIKF